MLKVSFQDQLKEWHKLVKGESNDNGDDEHNQGGVKASTAMSLTSAAIADSPAKQQDEKQEKVAAAVAAAPSIDMSVHFKPTPFERKLVKYVDSDGFMLRKYAKKYLEMMDETISMDDRALCLVGLSKVAHQRRPELRRRMLEGGSAGATHGGLFGIFASWVRNFSLFCPMKLTLLTDL
jgi:hypothetical protein